MPQPTFQSFEDTFKPGRLFMYQDFGHSPLLLILESIDENKVRFISLADNNPWEFEKDVFCDIHEQHFAQTTCQAALAWLTAQLTSLEMRISGDQLELDKLRKKAEVIGKSITALSR